MRFFWITAVVVTFLTYIQPTAAQPIAPQPVATRPTADFAVSHFNSDNGLPQNSVGQIAMDKYGFLWFTTQAGLVRFDGAEFKTYNKQNTPLLTSNRIIKVDLRTDSIVYFVDENSKMFSFDASNRIIQLPFNDLNKAFTTVTASGAVNIFDLLAPADRLLIKSVIPDRKTAIVFLKTHNAHEGFLWIHGQKLFYIADKKIRFSRDVMSNDPQRLLGNLGLFRNELYCIDAANRLVKIDENGAHTQVFARSKQNGVWTNLPASDLKLLRHDQGVHLLSGGIIYKLNGAAGAVLDCEPVVSVKDIAGAQSYRYYPSHDIHVIGSETKGLFILKPKPFTTLGLDGTSNVYYSQAVFKNVILTAHGIVPAIQPSRQLPPLAPLAGILRQTDGKYWVADTKQRISLLDSNLQLIKTLKGSHEVRTFRQTPDGNIWVATVLNQFGQISGDSIIWTDLRLHSQRMNFFPAGNHEFWMSDGGGFFLYDAVTGKRQDFAAMDGKEVREFYQDKNGVLWLGTYGHGFYAFKNGAFIQLPLDRHNHLLFTHAFREDEKGFMWMSTNHGLFKCRKTDLDAFIAGKNKGVYYYYYDKTRGFRTNEFNGGCTPSSVVLPDGRFSFPSMDGLVQFHPDSIRDILPRSPLLINYFKVAGEEMDFQEAIALSAENGRIEVKVASPFYGLSENQVLEYRLAGLEDNWYPLGTDGIIIVNHLPAGDYILQVRKTTGFGQNANATLEKYFTVAPFWYQTWYFRLAALLLILLAFYGIARLRYYYLLRMQRRLQMQVDERTLQLQYSNKLKDKITMLLAHDLQSPLHFLNVLSEYVAGSMDKNEWEDAKTGLSEISKAAGKIHSFVKEINLWTKSQQEHYLVTKRPFPFLGLAGELELFFREMLLFRNNVLHIHADREYEIISNREILKSILRNLIDNANKHTSAGIITVSLTTDENGASLLSVTDNGSGMSPADLAKIHRKIQNTMTSEGIDASGRLGYQIIVDFVSRLECSMDVTSEKGKGTTVSISGLHIQIAHNADFSDALQIAR